VNSAQVQLCLRLRRWAIPLAAVAAVVWPAGAAPAAVRVTRKPPAVTRHTFNPAAPPADMPKLGHREEAVCMSGFGVATQVRTVPSNRRLPDGQYRSSVLVESVAVELQLKVDIWVPTDAADKLKAHEEGHRQISERVYAEVADRAARVAGDALDGRRFAGEGATAAEAQKAADDAVAAAHQAMSKAYLDETNGSTLKVQEAYDALTDHGRVADLTEADAIARAWAKHTPRLWVPSRPPATGPATKPRSAAAPGKAAAAPAARP
jgi:hypothetical protein